MKNKVYFKSILSVLFIICILIFSSAFAFADDDIDTVSGNSTEAEEVLVPIDVPLADEDSVIAELNISSREELLEILGTIGIKDDVSMEEINLDNDFPKKFALYSGSSAGKRDFIAPVIREEAKNHRGKYSITVAVNQPKFNSYDCVAFHHSSDGEHIEGYTMGHVFMALGNHTGKDPEKDDIYVRGFYPAKSLTYGDVWFNNDVDGEVRNDELAEFNKKQTYWVDKLEYNRAVRYINDITEGAKGKKCKYNLLNYNCTTFSKDNIQASGLVTGIARHKWIIPDEAKKLFPRWLPAIQVLRQRKGCYPGAAGEQIKADWKNK